MTDSHIMTRRERRRQDTRERIFRAALALFAGRGVFATTIEDITEAADVGKGTFFNYFPSKEHVLAGFGQMQLAKAQAVLEGHAERPLRGTMRRLLRVLAEEPGRSRPLVRSLLAANLASEPVRRLLRKNLARGRRELEVSIVRAQRSGEVRRDRQAAEIALYFQQSFFGALLFWSLHPASRLATRLDAAFDLFWSGIRGRKVV